MNLVAKFFIYGLSVLLCFLANISQADKQSIVEFDLSITHNKLNLSADKIPLIDLLHAISQAAGFKLLTKGNLSQHKSVSLTNLNIDKAIIKLANEHAVIISYASNKTKHLRQLDEVRVYANNSQTIQAAQDENRLDSISKLNMSDAVSELEYNETLTYLSQRLNAEHLPIEQRLSAIELLGEMGHIDAIKNLQQGLSSPNKLLRSKTISTLGELRNLHASLALAQVTFGEPDTDLRLQALKALAKHDAQDAIIFIQEVSKKDQSPIIRQEASLILKQLKNQPQ